MTSAPVRIYDTLRAAEIFVFAQLHPQDFEIRTDDGKWNVYQISTEKETAAS